MANLEAWGWAGSSKWFASCGSYFSTDDGTALVKKAADAAINKKVELAISFLLIFYLVYCNCCAACN
ncbi:uncharacterized protein [Physcomitrium patens]|uniref:uncharacterized protein isoform X3 n=1 Tax=Physcomitrium patens TaxID=3218 RepID=UPI003CCDE3B4